MLLTNLANGYWQIPLHDNSQKCTTFLHNLKMYQFYSISFSFKMAGSVFIKLLHMTLSDQFEKSLVLYIVDFSLATCGSVYDHFKEVNLVLNMYLIIACNSS